MKRYLEYYENEWPENIAELRAIENGPFVGYLNGGVMYTVIPKPVVGPADNEIWYTTQEGVAIGWDGWILNKVNEEFENELVSNTYENGLGKLTFKNPVTKFGDYDPFSSLVGTGEVPAAGGYQINEHITSFILPRTITQIDVYAFSGIEVPFTLNIPRDLNSDLTGVLTGNIYKISVDKDNKRYYGEDCVIERSSNLLVFGCTSEIPYGVTSIGKWAFQGCPSLTSITIPNSVTSIGEEAICNCQELTTISIPDGVTSIGSWAITGCPKLCDLILPNSIKTIYGDSFIFNGNNNIIFNGTISEWEQIVKLPIQGNPNGGQMQTFTIECTDGTIEWRNYGS